MSRSLILFVGSEQNGCGKSKNEGKMKLSSDHSILLNICLSVCPCIHALESKTLCVLMHMISEFK